MSKCSDCGAPYEKVRPGSGQPTCTCHLKCPLHPDTLYEYRGEPDDNPSGWVCRKCESHQMEAFVP